MICQHNKNHRVEAKIACFENSPNGFMAEIRISCGDCGKAFQFLGLQPGLDTQGARVSVDGLEANIAHLSRRFAAITAAAHVLQHQQV